MYSNFETKKIRYDVKPIKKLKNKKKIIKLIPETNTKTSQVNNIINVWPRSGCDIKNKTIGNNKNKLIKYLKYLF